MKLTKTATNRLILILAFALSFLAVLISATFFDLQINTALYSPGSFYAQVISNIGEMPAYAALFFVFVVFYQAPSQDKKYYLLLKIIGGILVLAAAYALISNIFSNLSTDEVLYQPAYIVFFSAIVSVFAIFATNHLDKTFVRKLALFALFLLVVVALSQGIVFVAKHVFQRMRFRNMTDGAGFTPWYVINMGVEGREGLIASGSFQPDDAFKSFPSGHTANTACLFALAFLPTVFPKLKKFKPLFFVIAIVCTVAVAIARIVAGAHFLSDVLVGGTITVTVAALTKWLFEYVIRKKNFDPTFTGRQKTKGESVILSVGEYPEPASSVTVAELPSDKEAA